MRRGKKSAAQTPAPKSDKIYGSKKNIKGSAKSSSSAKSIILSDEIINVLKDKQKEYNSNHNNKVTLATLKAVFRRGAGAYSKSHRPTITGGAPNSRTAWSYARVNKFLEKKAGKKVKKAYIQDDDLLENGGLINGKPSNLTPEQYKLVRTPEFKAWFGDWENNPKNASKVVDENGEPLVVYHGAEIFNKAELGRFNIFKKGSYFTDTYKSAKYYAFKLAYGITDVKDSDTEIYNVFLNIRNPKIFDYEKDEAEDYFWDFDQNDKRIDKYISEGYDGILWEHKSKMYDTSIKELEKHFINFSPNQIKLADGTNTTFDIDNQDIRYEKGGEVNQDIVCVNCGWEWNTSDSDDSDKYVCHKCMFDNTLYYIKFSKNEQNDDIMSKLKQPKSLQEISKLHNVSVEILEKQLIKGIKAEKEHTTDDLIAETIALHHIEEIADYYDRLEKMEKSAQPIALPDSYSKYESLKKVLNNQGYDINEIEYNQSIENEFKEGGVVVGKRHSESDENGTGEKFLVESTGQIVELEGGEAVLSKESMQSDDKFSFQGKKMTGREIASILNHKYGGVEFEKGGSVDSVCGCKTKYYHGGELPTAIVDSLKGGEAVITVKTMESKDKYNFNNRSLTPRQILSIINEKSGGKKFEEGGILKSNQFNNTKHLTKMVYFTQKVLY